jgi:hypothetical protein
MLLDLAQAEIAETHVSLSGASLALGTADLHRQVGSVATL